ncbi:ParB N-terminal domain-containing protein [Caballeronia novacaledonica]|uniref:ParB N-terminal domain-containing protein n=1 Tax=Caballeronia novacaledonica TaxID=1544861 RepID=A0AA37MR62_9BURK|nr:ParB N-terminal domain-containing protein [Caballeronia novacaledonica]GJH23699.1 ParB N-terminal domain-containing protein [Caballeronia novacaledonica]
MSSKKSLGSKPRKGFKAFDATLEDLKFHHQIPKFSDVGLREVPLSKVLVCPRVFQVRDNQTTAKDGVTDKHHVATLHERLKKEGKLDPISVLPISYGRYVVIDGTHRRAAYQREFQLTGKHTIWVDVYGGTPSEALMDAGLENYKAKLGMDRKQKTRLLYGYIRDRPMGDNGKPWTNLQCAAAADRSESLANQMSGFVKKCREAGKPVPDVWSGGSWTEGREQTGEVSARVRAKAEKLAELFGALDTPTKLEEFAKAMGHAYGERAGAMSVSLARVTDNYEALQEDFDERMNAEREEAAKEAREQALRDANAQGSIAAYLFEQIGHQRPYEVFKEAVGF